MRSSVLPWVHSVFRSSHGEKVVPKGLQWSLPGTSHVRFVLPPSYVEEFGDSEALQWALFQAYHRWCCAKDLKFRRMESIASVVSEGKRHFRLDWRETPSESPEKVTLHEDAAALLQKDAENDQEQPTEVWIGGEWAGHLMPSSVGGLIAALPRTGNKLAYKTSEGRIRIERYYQGHLRPSRDQVWDHLWDNLVALEDPELLGDHHTLVGTATLRDWVRGGNLTSRLLVEDRGDRILFLRPLRDDDPTTSDRHYELDGSDPRAAAVRRELERLHHLSELEHPVDSPLATAEDAPAESHIPSNPNLQKVREKLRANRKRRKFFGI